MAINGEGGEYVLTNRHESRGAEKPLTHDAGCSESEVRLLTVAVGPRILHEVRSGATKWTADVAAGRISPHQKFCACPRPSMQACVPACVVRLDWIRFVLFRFACFVFPDWRPTMFETITSSFRNIIEKIRGGGRLTEENLSEAVRMIRRALLEADVQVDVAKDFCARVKDKAVGQELISQIRPDQQFVKIVHDELIALMAAPEGDDGIKFVTGRPTVIMLAGLNGAGKTTTSGKLALLLKKQFGKDPLLVAADLARPAAIEQLQIIGQKIGVPVYAPDDPTKISPPKHCLAAIDVAKKQNRDVVILDTAGRRQIDEPLMKELEEVQGKVKPDITLLVVDGMTGQDAANSSKVFDARLNLSGVILTKLDGDARGGAALSVRAVTGKPIRFIGVGEKAEDFEVFRPRSMADRILGMGDVLSLIEQVQSEIKQDEAERMAEKLLLDTFTLEDFLDQLAMVERLGSFKSLLGKMPIPGMSAEMMDDFDDREIDRIKAVIRSMTPRERNRPEIIDASRKRRIAFGAGVEVATVNELLKSFKVMQDQMKKMKEQGGMLQRMGLGMMRKSKEKKFATEKKQKRKIKRW